MTMSEPKGQSSYWKLLQSQHTCKMQPTPLMTEQHTRGSHLLVCMSTEELFNVIHNDISS